MSQYCEDCGNRIGVHGREWCNEELYILDQYYEQDMELPDENTDFMRKVNEQLVKLNSPQKRKRENENKSE